MTFKKKTLPNGLRILAIPMKDAPSVTVMSLIEAGSEYETKANNGISHFLEHICFKGTIKRPTSLDIAKEFDGMGAQNNAFTGNEFTGYYGKCHPKHTEKVLDIIADIYLNPQLPEAELEKEKGVIIEEINMYEDVPQQKVIEVFFSLLYGDTPAGWSIAGPKANIQKMTRNDLVAYRTSHYVADKTLIVVGGNIDTTDIFKKVRKAFKDIPTGKRIAKKKMVEKQTGPEIKIHHKDTDQIHMILGFRTFKSGDKRVPALKVLANILGGKMMSSRLFQRMREELGICYYVSAGANEFIDHGNMMISAGVDKTRLEEAVSGILGEVKKIRDEKIRPEELKKVKDYMIGTMYLGLESSDSLVEFYGGQEIMRETIKTPKEAEKEIQKVTAEEVQKLAKQIFANTNISLAVVGNVADEPGLKKILSGVL
jgi:predicted Zn-dependent peptidase